MCRFRIIERNKNGRIFYIIEKKSWLGWNEITDAGGFYAMEYSTIATAKSALQRLKEYYYPEIKDKIIYEE